jgi:hypothetical protein
LNLFGLLVSSASSSVDASAFGCVVILSLCLTLNYVISSLIVGTLKSVYNTFRYIPRSIYYSSVKWKARLKCILNNTRAYQEEYTCSRKRIAAARECLRKKRKVLKRKVDQIVEFHTKNEIKKFHKRIREVTQEFKPRTNACKTQMVKY